MSAVLGLMVFSGASATAGYSLYHSLAPQWQRICRLATGHVEQPFAPLRELAVAERRIAVRRWASPRRVAIGTRAAA